MTFTKITLTPYRKLMNFCKQHIGREPKEIRMERGSVVIIFEPVLTSQEKQNLNQHLPPFIEKIWNIIVEDLEAEPPPEFP